MWSTIADARSVLSGRRGECEKSLAAKWLGRSSAPRQTASGHETARPALHQSSTRPRVLLQRIGNSIREAAQPWSQELSRWLENLPEGTSSRVCVTCKTLSLKTFIVRKWAA